MSLICVSPISLSLTFEIGTEKWKQHRGCDKSLLLVNDNINFQIHEPAILGIILKELVKPCFYGNLCGKRLFSGIHVEVEAPSNGSSFKAALRWKIM